MAPLSLSSPYSRVRELLDSDHAVLLDGPVGTELPSVARPSGPKDEAQWGLNALVDAPDQVLGVHRDYVAAGCHVISTGTWGLATTLASDPPYLGSNGAHSGNWMDLARAGLRLAQRAAGEGETACRPAVAFSLNGDIDSPKGRDSIPLLARVFAEGAAPDLVLLETLAAVDGSLEDTVGRLLEIGLPVWLSFRRCRHGPCGVHGEHWGGPEGDAFGRAAHRFEEVGVQAVLVNCIPPDHVDGVISYLRDFTDLPLGAYPNLGYLTDAGWRSDPELNDAQYADMAARWREEGAQIIGGCCGVRPSHVAATGKRLEHTARGRRSVPPAQAPRRPAAAWTDRRRRRIYPLPFPEITIDPGVAEPDPASYMLWKHLFTESVGAHQRCADVGCGSGLLAIQLALNGAAHVHALDSAPAAVTNTMTNAFRNGVQDRVTATEEDLFPWTPKERYEIVVADLPQLPTAARAGTHRPVDYWGRLLVDRLLSKLDRALTPEGVAYVSHLSILSQDQTQCLIEAEGFEAQVVDLALYRFTPALGDAWDQIDAVEALTDAHHVRIGQTDVAIAYLLEITRAGTRDSEHPR